MTRTLYARGTIGADEWTIYRADPDDPDLATDRDGDSPHEGVTLFNERTILVRNDLPAKAVPGVIAHELVHAALFSHGLRTSLRLSSAREEAIAQGVGSGVAQFMTGAGLWKQRRAAR